MADEDDSSEWDGRSEGSAALEEVRGQAGVNLAAIGEALQRISQLVTDFPQIAELDINPFIVGGFGEESVAADARIQLSAGGAL